ncbi:nicotinate-nucleotide adenylyltransferase [Desulfothermus okinawensis JCM 13304]
MKIGLVGGSFNPVHNGHLRVAIEVKEQMDLDVVEFIPAPRPPHKLDRKLLEFEKRVELLEMAIEKIPFLKLNTIEANRNGPSYTVTTLRELRKIYGDHDLYFVIGGDEIVHLTNWYKWRELFDLSNFIVVGRREGDLKNLELFISSNFKIKKEEKYTWNIGKYKLHYIEIPRLEISSSLIRHKVAQKKSLMGLVPESIEKKIHVEYCNYANTKGV